MIKKSLLLAGGLMAMASLQADDIAELKQRITELEQRQEAMADGMGGAGSSILSKTHLGGYGELHYNNLNGKGALNGKATSDKKEFDFHRFVLMVNHEFTDKVKLYTELELEHALVKDTAGGTNGGEVELEQAYVDFQYADHHHLKAGLFLVPVGLLNETHEPETFYGTERNPVENKIIPTTWWESGLGLSGSFSSQLKYDVAVHSGLKSSDNLIRGGRQKSSNASAEDLAFTARLAWAPVSNLQLSFVVNHQGDIGQGAVANLGSATLYNINADYQLNNFRLKALYATWQLSGSTPEANGNDEQTGFYIEPSYKFNNKFGIFARYNNYDNTAGSKGTNGEKKQWDIGLNYWPVPNVVFKADYQNQDNDNGSDQDGFNLGVGYSF